MKDLTVLIGFVLVSVLVTIGFSSLFQVFANSQASRACEAFATESYRETKFVQYTFWQPDCLTSKDGKVWISAYNLRDK